jgi:hypothetical protein
MSVEERRQLFESIKILLKHGADLSNCDRYAKPPYKVALEHNDQRLMNLIKYFEGRKILISANKNNKKFNNFSNTLNRTSL